MIKLILNNTFEAELTGFNRNTNFEMGNEQITSQAYCYVRSTSNDIYALANETITSLKIMKDDKVLYDAGTIDAHLVSVDENLNGEEISVSFTLRITM